MTQSEAQCRLEQMQAHVDEGGKLNCDQELLNIISTQNAALKKCVEALEYYADRGNYFVGVDQMHPTVFKPTNVDEGYRARQTLAELKEILHDR